MSDGPQIQGKKRVLEGNQYYKVTDAAATGQPRFLMTEKLHKPMERVYNELVICRSVPKQKGEIINAAR